MIHTRYGGSGLGLFICKSKSSRELYIPVPRLIRSCRR
jgi:hypothetical protein